MEFLRKIDDKLMSWFGGLDAQGKPKVHRWRMLLGNTVLLGVLIWRMNGLRHGEGFSFHDIELFLIYPIHFIYSQRALRRYELMSNQVITNELLKPITIPSAAIVPPHLQIRPKRIERVKVAVQRLRR